MPQLMSGKDSFFFFRKKTAKHDIDGLAAHKTVAFQCHTVKDLLDEYIAIYGKDKWAISTYEGNVGLIHNYILPILGKEKLSDINTRFIEKFYQKLWMMIVRRMQNCLKMHFMERKKTENTLKVPEGVDTELLEKVLSSSEMATLLASLAKTIKG